MYIFFGGEIAWYYLSVYRSVFEWHKPEMQLLFNGRKSWCCHLCTLLFTLHFYWSKQGLDLIETADLQKHIHLKEQWKRKICEREWKITNEKRTSEWVKIMIFQGAVKDIYNRNSWPFSRGTLHWYWDAVAVFFFYSPNCEWSWDITDILNLNRFYFVKWQEASSIQRKIFQNQLQSFMKW